ncbi:hypothetical protein IRT45_20085 [Nocardia sp. BSTN01]|uniref:hypothetical protein n=1 Tax=Nocardia sp. BSTN01 TaxID=2783665 RepID=UPI0018904F07|nr:hypothetical protein [Nocardia sp. BSTN01]MBF4999451.1 hypothetical protein [Nocardia sp. BSTN01]
MSCLRTRPHRTAADPFALAVVDTDPVEFSTPPSSSTRLPGDGGLSSVGVV